MGGHVLRHAEIKHVEGFLLERLVVGFADERFVELLGNFLLEALFNDGARGFSGTETGDAGLAGVAFDDLIALTADFFGWDFHAQGGDALWLLLDDNVHNKWARLRAPGRGK